MVLVCCTSAATAGDVLYSVAEIPRELKENARSVIRMDDEVFQVNSVDNAVLTVTYAVTVLNKNGLDDAIFLEYYDKFSTISGIKGRIFDENGNQTGKIAAGDIVDRSAISGFSLYEDSRAKYIDPQVRTTPFTVEYSYTVTFNGLFGYPAWSPIEDFNMSVEKSTFRVIVNNSLELRYKERNVPSSAERSTDGKNNIFKWQATLLKAIVYEPFSPPPSEYFPSVIIAPSAFEIGGYAGNLSTWAGMGDWIYTLNEGKGTLPPATVSYLQNLVKDAGDDYNKVERVYKYMQGRVRYVNIQTGMGGWQPIPAADVQRLCYGDCKALTNYMMAMLEAVGIRSYYCLVRAGASSGNIMSDFPAAQFNHAMLCIPSVDDTLWLECTSQQLPCGYIGDFTDDRDVLLVTKGASSLVRTRSYDMDNNLRTRIAGVKLEADGSGTVGINTVFTGLQYEEVQPVYLADDADRKKMISQYIKFPGFELVGYYFKEHDSIIPSIDEKIQVHFENYLTMLDSRYLMPLNFTSHLENAPANVRSRKRDVVVTRPFRDVDTVTFELPATLKVESLPSPVDIVSPYGGYKAQVSMVDGKIVYTRDFHVFKGRYPADSYLDFVEFFNKVMEADDMKCILTKQ